MPRSRCAEQGQAVLPFVLVVVLLLGIVGITLAATGFFQTQFSSQRAWTETARQAAQAGINDALLRISRDKDWSPPPGDNATTKGDPTSYPLPVRNATVTVSVDRYVENNLTKRIILVSGTFRGVIRTLFAIVEVSPTGRVTVVSRGEGTP